MTRWYTTEFVLLSCFHLLTSSMNSLSIPDPTTKARGIRAAAGLTVETAGRNWRMVKIK